MKIIVAGKDRSSDLGSPLITAAQERMTDPRCAFLPRHISALSLADARNERDYLERLVELIRYRQHFDTRIFEIPHRSGFRGRMTAKIKEFLWRLLRYQHDRVSFRQNVINSQVHSALEFQNEEIKKLTARIAELERRHR